MVLDIDKVCRLCLEISSNSIFYPGNPNGHQTSLNEDLISRIFQCTSLKVAAGDGLPESVCNSCTRLIDKFSLFRKMCWEVDDKLRQYIFNQKEENQEQFSSLPNPVRLDPDQLELTLEVKDSWICSAPHIKGERDTSEDEVGNGNNDNQSDEEFVPSGSKSPSKGSKQSYCCDMCNESFRTLPDLKSHKEENHPKSKKSKPIMTCSYCNKSFKQMKRYQNHVQSHEDPLEETDETEGRRTRRKPVEETDSDSRDENAKSQLKKESVDETNKSQPAGDGKKRKFIRKIYDCEYCDQIFYSHAKYTQHELTHTGEKKYNCSDCSRSFTHKHSLIGHIKEQHTGEVNFTCDVCGRGFVHQSTYNIHKKTHSTEKPLKCPDCDKCFTQMKNLRVHRQIHSASRTHTCQVCGKSFNFMKTLKVHLVLHSGEKPYVCTYCGKAFAQSAPLKTHTRIHTGEKPYLCTICPLRFSTNNALKLHVLKHSGEAPYSCTVCNKGFSRKKDMVAHQEEMHGVYIGLPGQNNLPENSTPPQQTCLPQTLPVLPPPSGPHVSPHQSPSQNITPQHQHPHGTHQVPCIQLHTMPDHPPSLPPPPNCLPHPPQYNTSLHRTDLPGTDCSGG